MINLAIIGLVLSTHTLVFAQEEVSSIHLSFEDVVNPGGYIRTANVCRATDGGYYQIVTLGDGRILTSHSN